MNILNYFNCFKHKIYVLSISILRKAGIELAETMIIVSIDKIKQLDDNYISDSTNIFAVHNIKRFRILKH